MFSSDSVLQGITAGNVHKIWDEIKPLIERGLKCEGLDGKFLPEDILKSIINRDLQLWVSLRCDKIEALMLTEIVHYPQRKVLNSFLIVGKNIQNWIRFVDIITDWAKERGCKEIEAQCRRGWQRFLPDWKVKGINMGKAL